MAWPTALFGCVWLFRGELRPLLPKIHLKHKDTEVSFRLDRAEQGVDHGPAPALPPPTAQEDQRLEQLAQIAPNLALIEIWQEVEESIRRRADEVGVRSPDHANIMLVLRELQLVGKVDPGLMASISELRALRNTAAHHRLVSMTASDVKRYRDVGDHIIARLSAE